MADVSLSSLKRAPRRETYVLTSSNASFPIPSWAQGGKGIVYVTGCGGGGGGSAGRGGSAAFALDHPILIPSGVSTLSVAVGAGGAASTNIATLNAATGGGTSVSVGGVVALSLGGGGGGRSSGNGSSSGNGGLPFVWGDGLEFTNGASTGTATDAFVREAVTHGFRLSLMHRTVSSGVGGGNATPEFPANLNPNRGGFTIFGSQDGGYGGGAGSSAAGRPGFLMLKFVEGF